MKEDEEGPVGPFRSWRGLYATVLVYWAVLVVALYAISELLDAGAP